MNHCSERTVKLTEVYNNSEGKTNSKGKIINVKSKICIIFNALMNSEKVFQMRLKDEW